MTEKFLMARNFFRIFTENNPVMGSRKTFFIPEAKGLKPLHTIGKVSVNASILYKNQEICNKNQPVKISADFVISFTRKQ